jgi:ribosomal protein S18 acetylase RimI-like enzyme
LAQPEDSGTWNLWWIGIDPKFHGQGLGKQLLEFVENTVKSNGASHLIIETSSSDLLSKTRRFYELQEYIVSHTEVNGYGPNEDKVVFKKTFKE